VTGIEEVDVVVCFQYGKIAVCAIALVQPSNKNVAITLNNMLTSI
jgi:hypothetical protein